MAAEEIGYIQSLGDRLAVKSFNMFGFSSMDKIVLANHIDFYVGNMNADMLYPCYISKKYEVYLVA